MSVNSKKSKVYSLQKSSDFVNEILDKTPSWIILWGNTLFVLFILLLIVLSSLISYPDRIIAPVNITLENPPIAIVSQISGEIQEIFKENKDEVEEDEIILKFFSRVSYSNVLSAKQQVQTIKDTKDIIDILDTPLNNISIAELSNTYTSLMKEVKDFKYNASSDAVFQSISSLRNKIAELKELNRSMRIQEKLFEEQHGLSKTNLERNRLLNQKGVISDVELESIESTFLEEKRQLENFRSSQINNTLEIEELKYRISDLTNTREKELQLLRSKVSELANTSYNEIEAWERNHIIKSPVSGVISMEETIKKNYFVREDETIFHVIPKGDNKIIGLAKMPIENSGGVDGGEKVQIRLDAYPHQEFGIIEGEVLERALLPSNGSDGQFVSIKISVPSLLITDQSKKIPFEPNLSGTAFIIKEKKSLLARFFDNLSPIFRD